MAKEHGDVVGLCHAMWWLRRWGAAGVGLSLLRFVHNELVKHGAVSGYGLDGRPIATSMRTLKPDTFVPALRVTPTAEKLVDLPGGGEEHSILCAPSQGVAFVHAVQGSNRISATIRFAGCQRWVWVFLLSHSTGRVLMWAWADGPEQALRIRAPPHTMDLKCCASCVCR